MFEYKILDVNYNKPEKELEDQLNELGKDDWELVVGVAEANANSYRLILKRKKS